MKKIWNYFNTFEKLLWFISCLIMILAYIIFKNKEYLYLIGSIIGVTSLMFFSKANPYGQIISVIFCIFYGYVSYTYQYYGEVAICILMSLPCEIICGIEWFKNQTNKGSAEVSITTITKKEYLLGLLLGVFVTFMFYFILKWLNTSNLIVSTISIFTSFLASFMSIKRSRYYALWYALNDLVLITIWILAAIDNIQYLSLVICFVTFLANDIYGFINWTKLEKIQKENAL